MKDSGMTSSRTSPSSASDKALTGLSNLIKLLPTGTVFLFQFLSPVFSNNGHCYTINKVLTSILLALCGASCAFTSFTDSYTDSNGKTHYVVVTSSGIWPPPTPSEASDVDVSKYRLKMGDFAHAFFAVIVFAALAILDDNTVECLLPALEKNENTLLAVLTPVVGAVSGAVFAVFPSTRHGIGYATASSSAATSSPSDSNSRNSHK